jgi:hypothetical protein
VREESLREAHGRRVAQYMAKYSEEWKALIREAYLRVRSGWIPVTRYCGLLDDLIDENEKLARKFGRVRRTYRRERRPSWKIRRELWNGLQYLM